jgi:hypothetical protein
MGELKLRESLDDYKSIYMTYRNSADRAKVDYQNDLQDFSEFLAKEVASSVSVEWNGILATGNSEAIQQSAIEVLT